MNKPKKQFKNPATSTPLFPMRINKYLAHKGYATRREADTLVEKGLVFVNGEKAKLGDKVYEADAILVKNRTAREYHYYAYHKPKGIVVSSPGAGETEITKHARFPVRVFPIGRLDKDSTGLVIMTNDGRITDKLLNPENNHDKEYIVTVDKNIYGGDLMKMESGMKIEKEKTRPAKATKLSDKKANIILSEGKKHQIRRMFGAVGYTVRELKRMRVMNIELQSLKPNAFREITGTELEKFLSSLGMK